MKKDSFSAEELDSWGWLAQARKERKRSKVIENENIEEENKENSQEVSRTQRNNVRGNAKKWMEGKGLNEKHLVKLAVRHKNG